MICGGLKSRRPSDKATRQHQKRTHFRISATKDFACCAWRDGPCLTLADEFGFGSDSVTATRNDLSVFSSSSLPLPSHGVRSLGVRRNSGERQGIGLLDQVGTEG